MPNPDPAVVDGIDVPVLGHSRAVRFEDDATVTIRGVDSTGEPADLVVDEDGALNAVLTEEGAHALTTELQETNSLLRVLILLTAQANNLDIPDDPGEV